MQLSTWAGRALVAIAMATAGACSLVTVQQDPFPPLEIRAERPPPPPARVVLTDSNIQIADKVQFETGSDKLLPVSFPLLDQVAQVMVDNPQIELVEIQGHTDSTGSAALNLGAALPVPGQLGVIEAGFALALAAFAVPTTTAVTIALAYRLAHTAALVTLGLPLVPWALRPTSR